MSGRNSSGKRRAAKWVREECFVDCVLLANPQLGKDESNNHDGRKTVMGRLFNNLLIKFARIGSGGAMLLWLR